MATLLEVRFGTGVASWIEQTDRPNSQPKSRGYFCIDNQDPTLMIYTHILVVIEGSQVGTLPPCWDLGLGSPCAPALTLIKREPIYLLN